MTLLVESPIYQMSLGMWDWAQHIPSNANLLHHLSWTQSLEWSETVTNRLGVRYSLVYPTLLFISLKCASKVAVFNTDKTLHKVLYIFGDLCFFDVPVDMDMAQMEKAV